MKQRYFLEIAYKGSGYHGWQVQKNAFTVQEALQDCLVKLLGQEVTAVASGRTDAGVHARQQFAHIDLYETVDERDLTHRLNSFLPEDIAVKAIRKVNGKAHARYSAFQRTYEYNIHQMKNPFLQGFSYFYPYRLDIQLMNEAAEFLLDTQVFQSFSRVKTYVKNFICDVSEASWREEEDMIIFRITANRFLRGMVRAVAGTLIEVGTGDITLLDFKRIIESKDRKMAGRAVPGCGLYLHAVKYPDEIFVE